MERPAGGHSLTFLFYLTSQKKIVHKLHIKVF